MTEEVEGPKESDWLRAKREDLQKTKQSVEDMMKGLDKQREDRLRERAKQDVCFWMDNAIFPFLDGIAEGYNEPLLVGIQRLIKEKKNPFRPKEDWNRTRETSTVITSFLANPQTRILQILAKPYLKSKMEWINKEAEWIREAILKEEYPDVYEAIIETEGGKEWLDELITDFIKTLRKLTR